ncbi:MAG: hypothetical protein PVF73_10505 [Bacteroidales bacterium]|jgi:hypothetical protein
MIIKGTVKITEKASIRFDASTGIFFKIYSGDITLNDLETSWETIIEKKYIPEEVTGFILDYSNAKVKMDISQTKGIAEFYNQHLQIFKEKKIGLIMTKPEQVIFPMLVESRNPPYYLKAFNTEHAAINWVIT